VNLKKFFSTWGGWGVGSFLGVGLGALLMLDLSALLHLGSVGAVGDRLGKKLQYLSYDLLFAPRPYIRPQEVVLVYLDDDSHEHLKQPYDKPWDRSFHARLLERLKKDNAKAAVFDVVFADPGDPEKDAHLARAIKDFGKVVLAADWTAVVRNERGEGEGAAGNKTILPLEMFLDAAAGVGTAEMSPSADLFIRQHFPGAKDDLVSSLSWTAAETVGAEITKNPELKFKPRWVNYYGPPTYLPFTSFYKAISTDPEEGAPPGFFRDKVVYVGAKIVTFFSGQRKDEYRTPYAFWTQDVEKKNSYMPGVEIQATVFLNLLRGDWITRVPFLRDLAIVLVSGLLFGFGLTQLRPVNAAIVAVVSMALISYVAYYFFVEKLIWFSWFIIVGVQIPAAMSWSILYNSIQILVQKKLMQQSLGMYVSPSRVNQILARPDILKPGAEKMEVSILFSDIAGFTSISEGMDSDELANLMNRYFETTVGQCIDPVAGTVVKFIGDAIFAIWNAPLPQGGHQELACRGGLYLRDHATSFMFKPGVVIRTRVGLHCGVANVGNFGSSRRIDYTAFGENINLASRMEGLNKYLGTDVLITGEVQAAVTDKFVTRFCGQFKLKGFEKAVDVHELIALPDKAEATRAWREAYGEALKHYQSNNLDEAERGFQCTIQLHPEDGPSQFFLKHIKEVREHPPEGEWSQVVELKEK
jgi:adenylate cyclase